MTRAGCIVTDKEYAALRTRKIKEIYEKYNADKAHVMKMPVSVLSSFIQGDLDAFRRVIPQGVTNEV